MLSLHFSAFASLFHEIINHSYHLLLVLTYSFFQSVHIISIFLSNYDTNRVHQLRILIDTFYDHSFNNCSYLRLGTYLYLLFYPPKNGLPFRVKNNLIQA